MNKIYIIEIDESDAYEVRTKILTLSFKTYDSAKNFLLKDFDCQIQKDGKEWFSLKEGRHIITDYEYDAIANIMELELFE